MADVFSTWNWKKGQFDYFALNRARPYRERVGYPAKSGLGDVGEVAEDSVNPVPAGATYIGSGDQAIGIISSPRRRSAVVFIAVAALGLWYFWRK